MINNYKYDFLIVGAGLFGATFAYEATKAGKSVLVIDKRNHIGGNCYTENVENIEVHKYGPHIFHTNNKTIWDWINQFGEFNNFVNTPIAKRGKKLYNLPINMNTLYQIYGCETPTASQKILKRITSKHQNKIDKNLENRALKIVGDDIYKLLIKDYTEKQWGKSCKELPAEIINRIPIRFTFDNNYYNCRYQGVPVNGYTSLIKKMLKGADILLNTSYEDLQLTHPDFRGKKIIYTGPIDEFFNYSLGMLEWRSLEFKHTEYSLENFQGNAVINYVDKKTPFTRVIEHKHFYKHLKKSNKTIISQEYPRTWELGCERYYPIESQKNNSLQIKYEELAKNQFPNIHFCGRLGSYKYLDMDKIIENALTLSKLLLND